MIKLIPQAAINRIRNYNGKALQISTLGKSSDINDYSDTEISEMYYGIYKDKNLFRTDGDYFIDLAYIDQIVCVLKKVGYKTNPTQKNMFTNKHNHIKNIKTFWISDYFLFTTEPVGGMTKHKITNLLHGVGAIRKGSNKNLGLFSIENTQELLRPFNGSYYPLDLYYPIQNYINKLVFNMTYCKDNFKVESDFIIESSL